MPGIDAVRNKLRYRCQRPRNQRDTIRIVVRNNGVCSSAGWSHGVAMQAPKIFGACPC